MTSTRRGPVTDADVVADVTEGGVVGIVRGADADVVIDVVDALVSGGVRAVEITADTDGVLGMLEDVTASFGGVSLGAGTVLDSATARAVMLAGAEFVVTPTVDRGVIETCNRYSVPVVPGAFTPTEALSAVEAGADLVKVFPASTGGPDHVAALGGPLGQIPLVPTGGVDLENAGAYLDAGADALGVGSALVDERAVARGDFAELERRARTFRETVASRRP
jgi:2-dehydro-3-deoxyphosphogluconate aldolase/(4S)-4-hydroxy-2-oxoglutarate aldolase